MIQLQLFLLKITLQRGNKLKKNSVNITADLLDKADLVWIIYKKGR